MRRTVALTLAAIAATVLTACGEDSQGGEERSKSKDGYLYGEERVVFARDNYFDPGSAKIATGDTITWQNAGAVPHNVVAKSFSSGGPVNPGDKFHHGFAEVGTYRYHCTIHPGMDGTIQVTK